MGEDIIESPVECAPVLDVFASIAEACDLTVPERHRRAIGVVGAGAIVQVGHLPAYQRAGLQVAGICDLHPERAEEVRDRFGLARTFTLEELLDDPAIEVVDIAVVPEAQPEIVRRALMAGKHVLAQKPLAVDSTIGAELAELARKQDRKLVVNQQMRYGEGIAAARAIVEAGWLGEPTAFTMEVNISTDWSAWEWLVASPRLDLMYHSIHYFDSIRSVLGTPQRVFCAAGRRPGQIAAGETRTMTTFLYEDGRRGLVHVNHENLTGDFTARFRIDGSQGSLRGTIGLLYDYPYGRPDTLEVNGMALPTDGWLPYPVTTRWVPDAFVGPMRALLAEVADGTPAPTSGADNLETLRVVEACYASINSGDAVQVARP
ncbi:MAG: gfo/Idh/MocA family oxidoreductase [Actinomycetia bacterium]|jgi:predicted dehydrogenase|nr:gfo/Idh/MocA family oxidoreductase [Actinomycetes bacterium]